MNHVVVAGITNIETAVPVGTFPVEYRKSRFVFHGVRDRPGGVGYNVANGIAHLGAPVAFATMLGCDILGESLAAHLRSIDRMDCRGVRTDRPATLRSVILVGDDGAGAIFTDLKDAQDSTYPPDALGPLLSGAACFHATNIEWALPLARIARAAGLRVSTDVQAIRELDDAYNRRFIEVADTVIFSGENLVGDACDAIRRLWSDFDVEVALCTMADRGLLLGDRAAGTIVHQPATPLRTARNVTGAGDSFVAGFLAARADGYTAAECALRGQLVAGWRIGEEGAGHGLPSRDVLEAEFSSRRATANGTVVFSVR